MLQGEALISCEQKMSEKNREKLRSFIESTCSPEVGIFEGGLYLCCIQFNFSRLLHSTAGVGTPLILLLGTAPSTFSPGRDCTYILAHGNPGEWVCSKKLPEDTRGRHTDGGGGLLQKEDDR